MRGDGSAVGTLATVRAAIARAVLSGSADEPTLGDITLRRHQIRAVAQLRQLLARHRGAVLADEAGMGKTFVALAVARRYHHPLVVAPASLRSSWQQSLGRTRSSVRIESLQRLSRAALDQVATDADLVIVDEAHHLRTPTTKRYAVAAMLCDRAHVLLLSATPVQNRRGDLAAQLALFLGDAAWSMNDAELSGFVVRRKMAAAGQLPIVDGPHWIQLGCEDDLADALVRLPPAVPGTDEGDAGVLVTYGLLRQWASSRAAIVQAVRRRIARAIAMRASLESGTWPDRRALGAWTYADGALQLSLPELLTPRDHGAPLADLLAAVDRHEEGLREVLALARVRPDPDQARADALRRIRRENERARVIAFSEYTETVHGLTRLLIPDGGVAELTARGARIAGGRISRAEVLAQFAPGVIVPAHERIDLLITTDVLSEGLDLQAASVIVHLDLPWNPARLEQRVGRVRRIGSRHTLVRVYALAPPMASERALRIEERLRRKLGVAAAIVGAGTPFLPLLGDSRPDGAAEATSRTRDILERWIAVSATARRDEGAPQRDGVATAAVVAEHEGFLALIEEHGVPLLVADLGDGPTLDPAVVHVAVRSLESAEDAARADTARARDALTSWWQRRQGRDLLGLHTANGARLRSRLAAHIAALLARTPRHERARIAPLASRARHVLRAPLTVAAERALAVLGRARDVDEEWLRQVVAIAARRERTTGETASDAAAGPAVALRSSPSALPLVALVVLLKSRRAETKNDEARPGTDA